MGNYKFIGIGGVARSGKDTLFQILSKNLSCQVKRIALADNLKADIDPYLKETFGISAYTTNRYEKALIRDCFVAHAQIRRAQTKGTYYTNKVTPSLKEYISFGGTPIVTDIRYDFYPEDELTWLKNNNGYLIHVTRIDEDGEYVLPANRDEQENDYKIQAAANLKIVWKTRDLEKVEKFFIETYLSSLPNVFR